MFDTFSRVDLSHHVLVFFIFMSQMYLYLFIYVTYE